MRCTGYEMARYKGTQATHLYKKSMHTLCTIQWATAPGRSLNYPRPKSITHLRTFSDNGVYVALQLFLVILVSDQWCRVLIDRRSGSFTCSGMTLPIYMGPMLKARFLHLTNLVAQPGIEPPTSWLPCQRVTTRPRLSLFTFFIILLLCYWNCLRRPPLWVFIISRLDQEWRNPRLYCGKLDCRVQTLKERRKWHSETLGMP